MSIKLSSLSIWMPGQSYRQALPALTTTAREFQTNLKRDVETLATKIGPRNYQYRHYDNLLAAKDFLTKELEKAGYTVQKQDYSIDDKTFTNLIVEILGSSRAEEILVIGAHYDTTITPGANDNGTGAAAVLALARAFMGAKPQLTLRFVEFTNEEPPFFWTDKMGSMVYAKRAKQRGEKIVGMLSLETMGYFSDEAKSQKYPPPLSFLYPDRGNFIAFIGNINSREFVRNTIYSFRDRAKFPSEGAALPDFISGIGWSDHWSFWQQGYPALMITDTAPFRYPHYHALDDTTDKIDFEKLARVVYGVGQVIYDLARVSN